MNYFISDPHFFHKNVIPRTFEEIIEAGKEKYVWLV